MPQLKLLVLCGRSPRHLYVANALCKAGDVQAIVHETGSERSWASILRKLKPKNLIPKLSRWLRDRKRYLGNREGEFFFGDGKAVLDRPELVVEVPHINAPKLAALAARLQPDLICVFGTSLIRGPLLTAGRLGMVNLHGGLSPDYRGADCTFWALHNEQPEQVGCTLHYIDPGIDTGRLVAYIQPEVQSDDDELSLFWRGVRSSADVYAELMGRLARGERFGIGQTRKGTLYQVKQRKKQHEDKLDRLMANGLLRDRNLDLRVTWFSAPEQ